MASADRFAEIVEEQIPQVMNDFVNDFKPHSYLIMYGFLWFLYS